MTDDELDLVETEALVSALDRRSIASVVGLVFRKRDDDTMDDFHSYNGHGPTCVFLCERIKGWTIDYMNERRRSE